ncbi:substrate-binding domain-containing protein [Neobacillus muris]|uniref:substrate-binding domain-containing protein n=1 Tax=Neobacillus muris TaxID=2941334 RepID=UPI00203F9749|nr:substrate-binding domain-containing protein [Neobacillus muris]
MQKTDKILDLLNEAKNQIKSEPEYYRIATTETILSNYLSVRIKDELEKFQIYILGSSQLKNPLKEKKVDLVISYNDYADSEFKKLFSTNISIGLLKSKVKTDVNFLEEFFLVSHDKECPFRKCTIKFMEENHIPKKQLQLVDSYSFMKELVSQGKGIAFLPIQEPSERIEEILREAITLHFFTTKSSEKLIPKSLIE